LKRFILFGKLFLILAVSHLLFFSRSIAQFKKVARQSRAYYIQEEGNDRAEGSIGHPWKTLGPVNALVLKPGDSVLLHGGQNFSGTLVLGPGNAGNAARWILIASYDKGTATIQAGDSSAILIRQTHFISIRNLHLAGAGRKTGNVKGGLVLESADHIHVDRVDIEGFQKAGLLIHSSSDISAVNVYAHENGAAGIEVGGIDGKKDCNRLYFAHCLAEDNPGDPSNLTNHSGNGIVVGHCRNVTIEYCTATNNGWDMPRIGNGPVGIWAYEADRVKIQHCLSYRNKTSKGGADGGGFDLDGGVTNSIVQYCLSYENQGAGYCIFQYYYASSWHDNVFRYNISENDGSVSDAGGGIYVWNSSGDSSLFYNCQVYNNTVYNAKVAALSYSELHRRKNFAFYNNIFVGRNSLVKGNKGGDVFQGNDWWSLTKGSQEMLAEKIKGLSLDPNFKNPGHSNLQSSSALELFEDYKMTLNSPLHRLGVMFRHLPGIETVNRDFNNRTALINGIGACF
jgi:hypothetical protein